MSATRTPLRDRLERVGGPHDGLVNERWGWAPPPSGQAEAPDAPSGDPDEPGISLCERERRWACEWWPPD